MVRILTRPKTKTWISGSVVDSLMTFAVDEGDVEAAVLYGLAFSFLLRVPSELLCIEFAGTELTTLENSSGGKSRLQVGADEVRLHLTSRKNARWGATIARRCSCARSKQSCAVHALGAWFKSLPIGSKPFRKWYPAAATRALRRRLDSCGVELSASYTLHAFRRGAAHDMALAGSTLIEILLAGGWSSAAFLAYMKQEELNTLAATAMVAENSDSD
jgi:hypothetical protein